MRFLTFCLTLSLLSLLAPASSRSEQYPPGMLFFMAPGDTAVIGSYGFVVGFEGITSDSRCPAGVVCVWEGDAVASMWGRQFGPTQYFELHSHDDFQTSYDVDGYVTTLHAVDPYPQVGVEIDPEDYRILVEVWCRRLPVENSTWGRVKALYDRP